MAEVNPGGPAEKRYYIAIASDSGAADVSGTNSRVPQTNKVTPVKSFGYPLANGNLTFYKGMPRVVTPALKAQLLAAGLVT